MCLVAALLAACSKKPRPIAELTQAAGPVERQQGTAAWAAAQLGTPYFIGDAARTQGGSATFEVGGGGARILMQSHTVLRFGGKPGESKIAVESGAVDLSGTGSYSLDIGDVKLSRNGSVRITARGNGRSSVELTIGEAQVDAEGQTFALEIGKSVDVGKDGAVPVDAGVRDAPVAAVDAAVDAPVDAPVDAAVDAVADATLEVTGKKAELLAPGQTSWRPLPAGPAALARGSTVRIGGGTTATLTAGGTTLELGSGARVKLGDDAALVVEAGRVGAASPAPATLALPGGSVALEGQPAAPAEVEIDAGKRGTKLTALRGGSKLLGADGAELAMNRGETASLSPRGAIRMIDAIPGYFDFRVAAGESLTIHDPRPPTSVQLQFDGKCPSGGIIELDRDPRFRTAKVSSGRGFANVLISGGGWSYRLRCTANGTEGGAVASGRISVLRDDGRRPLPKNQGVNDIDADGRNYRISYQSAIPNVVVRVRNPGAVHKLHLASGGKERVFASRTAAITVPGAQLHEGRYTYWVDRDGVKQGKVSTLIIDFDQTAPQVYIESPANGQPWSGDLDVRGAVLPGWSAAVGAIAIPVDRQRRFSAKVGIPGGNALAIRLSHPQRGVHYYLRRPK